MARRQLEEALIAGHSINEGDNWPSTFSRVELLKTVELDSYSGGIYCLQYNYNGEVLAVGTGNGGILLFAPKTGNLIKELRKSRHGGLAIMCIRFHPKDTNILLAGTADGMVFACYMEEGTCKEIISERGNEINCLDFDLDGFNFATAGKDLSIRIYETKTCQLVKTFDGYDQSKPSNEMSCMGCSQRVFALKFHPEYRDIFLSGGWENHLKIWDVRTNDGVKRTIWGPHLCGDSLDMKGMKILTGSWTSTNALQVWNYTDGKLDKNIKYSNSPDGDFLYCAQYCENDIVLAGGSGNNSAQAIRITDGECIGSIKMNKPVQALDSAYGGKLFAVGGAENCLKLATIT
ncbi:hypothetical protein LOTGIDRAFT_229075 [Lottia gigantea]|uniref:Anaphase-promoting complex subunit 4-like WD40 domain-containing protein n=1 Tax=Lottia gigantea TaxID=225164 RepID=V4A2K7_LOTGI|nr:hypothetical protein LOTGIDRAFT_229075 [Lottia gigantea]ESO89175.1 hypothetical protein LOTGIDRAFT_229075 [Lottia gigantea]